MVCSPTLPFHHLDRAMWETVPHSDERHQTGQFLFTLWVIWISVQCTSLIGQYAAHAKYYRLEKVYRITVKMSLRKQTPSDFLKQIIGRPVVVKLNSGVDYRGVLACLDGYMNIAIEQTEEYVNGQLKNKYGDAFLRGNNVLYISTQKRKA
ncbi:hypothetical protein VZT92_002990 [Zoarces viviparus]|uniref:U6 snRNA-associated Sm-like protein LSm6 n=1 Tax=Zoarces viviparus TaxID=48416 RepID=A0AAW1FZU3_ZOAVI